MASPEATSISPSVYVPPTLKAAEEDGTYIGHRVIAPRPHDAELLHIRVDFQGFCVRLEGGYGDILQREKQAVRAAPASGRLARRSGGVTTCSLIYSKSDQKAKWAKDSGFAPRSWDLGRTFWQTD